MSQRPSTIKRNQLFPQVTTAIVMGQILITGCHYGPDYPIPQSQSSQTADTAQCSRLTDNRFVLEDDLGDFSHQPQDSYVQTPELVFDITVGGGVVVADFNGAKGRHLCPHKWNGPSLPIRANADFQATDWLPDINDPAHSVGGSAADFDGDGDMDLYLVTAFGSDRLYQNTGHSFEDVSVEAGISQTSGDSTAAVWFDYDLDGDLDVFVAGHKRPFSDSHFPEATANKRIKHRWIFERVHPCNETTEPLPRGRMASSRPGDRPVV